MKRNRLLVLSSVALIASGALVFACGDNGGDDDSGTDASNKDAKGDTTTTTDAKNDTTLFNDTGTDTGNDSSTTDGGTDTGSDTGTDAISDASSDAGSGLTFMVVRVGGDVDAGADAALSNASARAFIEERNVSDGSLVRTIALPTAVNGQNQPLTISGTATSEGELTTSINGHLVVVTGYAAAPGVLNVPKTTTDGGVMRVIARIDSAGNIDTTTQVAAFDQSNIRGAITDDGGSFWAVGAVGGADASATNAGVQYVLLSSTGASTNITSAPSNTRTVGVFAGQLFVGSASAPFNGVSTVGTGVPNTTGQTSTLLPGFAGDSGTPYGFSLVDIDASVTGLDTLYVADDSTQVKGGGIQKWVNNGTTWTKIATYIGGTSSTSVGFTGVMAVVSGNNVLVIGTTDDGNIIKYVDDGVNVNPTGTVLATAPTNTIFRGIALAPAP